MLIALAWSRFRAIFCRRPLGILALECSCPCSSHSNWRWKRKRNNGYGVEMSIEGVGGVPAVEHSVPTWSPTRVSTFHKHNIAKWSNAYATWKVQYCKWCDKRHLKPVTNGPKHKSAHSVGKGAAWLWPYKLMNYTPVVYTLYLPCNVTQRKDRKNQSKIPCRPKALTVYYNFLKKAIQGFKKKYARENWIWTDRKIIHAMTCSTSKWSKRI